MTTGPTTQVPLRLGRAVMKRLGALAEKFSRPGIAVTRSDVARVAIEAGLPKIEAERRKTPRR